jgi:phospholipid transport system substrate-binding protein
MIRLLFAWLAALGLLQAAAAVAEDAASPDALVKSVTNDVLAIVREDKDIQAGNTRRAVQLVEQKVLPHFDFTHMTQLAVGRDWRQASPEQQKALTEQFKTLLVRTYSNALTGYRNQVIDFKATRMAPADTDVTVRSEVKQPGHKPIPIDYRLEQGPNGWKVYDVIVAEVSLVRNYRESFAQEVRNGGIDGLIRSLQAKNKNLETAQANGAAK